MSLPPVSQTREYLAARPLCATMLGPGRSRPSAWFYAS